MPFRVIFSALFPKVRRVSGPKTSNLRQVDSKLLKKPDEAKFADDAKFLASLRAEMQTRKDLSREEKIAELEKKLAEGSYKIPADDLARKILGD